jgi:hypothetical protein
MHKSAVFFNLAEPMTLVMMKYRTKGKKNGAWILHINLADNERLHGFRARAFALFIKVQRRSSVLKADCQSGSRRMKQRSI